MFDITTQRVVDTTTIHLKGADGTHLYDDGKPVGIVVYGPGSTEFAELEDRQHARIVKRMQDNDNKLDMIPKEQRDAEAADDLARVTAGFENFEYPDATGKQGVELYKALYSDKKLGFIKEQVLKALRDWGKFKPASTVG
jgi:hypothetical protein